MWTPGLIGLAMSMFVLAAVRDKPADLGFPPVADAAAAPPPAAHKADKEEDKAAATAEAGSTTATGKAEQAGGMAGALRDVLRLPSIWALAFTYFFIYVVRQVRVAFLTPTSMSMSVSVCLSAAIPLQCLLCAS